MHKVVVYDVPHLQYAYCIRWLLVSQLKTVASLLLPFAIIRTWLMILKEISDIVYQLMTDNRHLPWQLLRLHLQRDSTFSKKETLACY